MGAFMDVLFNALRALVRSALASLTNVSLLKVALGYCILSGKAVKRSTSFWNCS
jgi:TRAP-type C4-dicarboxylate transport system permease small subunit